MAGYLKRTLGEDEELVYRARFHWTYHLLSWLWLLVLGVLVVGIVVWLQRSIRAWTTEMGVTSRRVVLKRGLFAISTEELSLSTVEEVNVRQSTWGGILGYGTITVSGTGEGCIEFPIVGDPVGFRAALQDARAASPRQVA